MGSLAVTYGVISHNLRCNFLVQICMYKILIGSYYRLNESTVEARGTTRNKVGMVDGL